MVTQIQQPTRAAIYRRVSSARQEERGYSLAGQARECTDLAAEIGAQVVLDREDVGSGADWDLPGLLDILEAAKRGEYDVLIVYDTSRLARDIGKLKVVERTLERAGVEVRYVRQHFDNSPTGQLQKDIMAAIDSYERSNLTIRFTLGKRAKVHRGLVMGQGRVPFGHRRVTDPKTGKTVALEIHPEQAEIVRRIVRDLQTMSVDEVAERLTADRIPTPTGGHSWIGASVYAIVNNPAIVGTYVHGKRTESRTGGQRKSTRRPESEWDGVSVPPIVSMSELEAARRAMEHRKVAHGRRRMQATDDDPFLLRGLIQCGQCGGQISVGSQRRRWRLKSGELADHGIFRYYTCIRAKTRHAEAAGVPPCRHVSWIPAEELEASVWEMLTGALLDGDRVAAAFRELEARGAKHDTLAAERQAEMERQIARRRRALDKISRELVMEDVDEERERSLRATAAQISAELGGYVQSLDQLQAAAPLGSYADQAAALQAFIRDISTGLEHATPAERQQVLRILQLRATINTDPEGERFGKHRYRIAWEGIINLSTTYHHPFRLNHHASTAPSTDITPMTSGKLNSQSGDGVKLKFMP